MKEEILLAGDIGGTKTVLALLPAQSDSIQLLVQKTFASVYYDDLSAIISEFLLETGYMVKTACFGVAGPVVDGRAQITKLPWLLNEKVLAETHNFTAVRLINDLVATGYALPALVKDDFTLIHKGNTVAAGAIGIIAPGTGLGEAFFNWSHGRLVAMASEGGHADFAPRTPLEIELLQYLLQQHDHVSVDRICSGKGIPLIYDFLKYIDYAQEPDWLAAKLGGSEDPAPVIVNGALSKEENCRLCRKTLQIFVSILGAEAGNLALKGLTTGGIYIGGGIPPKILPALQNKDFLDAFLDKGRMSDLMTRIPVSVILNPQAALLGAAKHVLELQNEHAASI